MLIHFFPSFADNADDSPFARELKSLGVNFRLFAEKISLHYPTRLCVRLTGWPKLAAFALRSALRSLWQGNPPPDVVVLNCHIEALVFTIARALRLRCKPHIVLSGFIYTTRANPLRNALRYLYFQLVLASVDMVICYSKLEARRYAQLFHRPGEKFVSMPYGLYIDRRENINRKAGYTANDSHYILAAGRSGRDYRTLFSAVKNLPCRVHVVCDMEGALAGLEIPSNVVVLRNCFGEDYVEELRNASLVVIPLAVEDISAGQMVLIQAMAFGKATVVTRTPTVMEYVADRRESLLVNMGDPEDMRSAVETLLKDRELVAQLGSEALYRYETMHSMAAFVRNLIDRVNRLPAKEQLESFELPLAGCGSATPDRSILKAPTGSSWVAHHRRDLNLAQSCLEHASSAGTATSNTLP